MTKELLFQLSTGDLVRNVKTNELSMVVAIVQRGEYLKDISELVPFEDWELEKSRLIVTDEERRRLKAYHDEIKKQMEKQK